ncbi:MAG: 50S ribosomal protein L21 [Candidatus Yonathbacteria bacterium]|nr:50S ribosomal protein L21 [Candidatus Yonathbacteria bacterium]
MAFAVIETGGKQYRIGEGQALTVEKLPKAFKAGETVVFDKVLLIDDGKTTKIGTPYLEGATVEAAFVEEGRAKKVTVIRYKAKSRYFKKRGHRQPFNKVTVSKIK